MKRSATLKRRRRNPVSQGEFSPDEIARIKRHWKAAACRAGCVMCKAFPVPPELRNGRLADFRTIEGHHVLAQRHLKRNGHGDRLWDTRNGMGLCRYHHGRHESWMQRVPRELVAGDAMEFADEVGLIEQLWLDYPEVRR